MIRPVQYTKWSGYVFLHPEQPIVDVAEPLVSDVPTKYPMADGLWWRTYVVVPQES